MHWPITRSICVVTAQGETFDMKQCEKDVKLDQFAGSWMRRNVNEKVPVLGESRSVRRGEIL
jgi:hypothetical protein